MAIAHSRDQLATLLPTMPWFSQLPQDVVDRFLSSIKYVEQKLATAYWPRTVSIGGR
jgi:hypothetical protein